MAIASGEILALVGEIEGLEAQLGSFLAGPSEPGAKMSFDGHEASPAAQIGRRMIRRHFALLRGLRKAPLNPRWTVIRVLEEPLRALCPEMSRQARAERIRTCLAELMIDEVLLREKSADLNPEHCQLIALARAMMAEPALLACTDPFLGLEVEARAALANQLLKIATLERTAVLLIQPDLAMAAHLADRIAVMAKGKILEEGPARDMRLIPQERYSRMIAAATRPF